MSNATPLSNLSSIEESQSPFLQVEKLSKHFYTSTGKRLVALNDVSLTINRGEVVGVVGESGCGKSTLGRTMLRLIEPTNGKILFAGHDVTALKKRQLQFMRKDAQIVFQDPFGALNPKHRVGRILSEPLRVHSMGSRQERLRRVLELLDLVGLPADARFCFPHEFSGGQRQRIAIARALASKPSLLVCDEAVSALDVSIQSQILNLLMELRERLHLSMLFISHDLSVVRHVSDRVLVMYLGKIIETAPTEQIMENPQHPYTLALLSAIPHPLTEPKSRIVLQGELPDPTDPPSGCVFHTRCQERHSSVEKKCVNQVPLLQQYAPSSSVACHLRCQ